jgi:hypothetical protein
MRYIPLNKLKQNELYAFYIARKYKDYKRVEVIDGLNYNSGEQVEYIVFRDLKTDGTFITFIRDYYQYGGPGSWNLRYII